MPPLIRLSPWEHSTSHVERSRTDRSFHGLLAEELGEADYPYDLAVVRLGFERPGIEVASLESDREDFMWDKDFDSRFKALLARCLEETPSSA